MSNEKKKKGSKKDPAYYNDQLGENASEEYAEDYAQKGKTAKSKQKK